MVHQRHEHVTGLATLNPVIEDRERFGY
ncbi:protein of unknown function [Pseudomonas mediterranea]